ncbi:MAG: glycosyltransferase family 4 protein [Vicinamibacterales bacterium]
MPQVVVMVTSSYPRFAGDGVGSFMEPIAKGIAARGHEVHLVAPWHPAITRSKSEDGVFFHFYRYAPLRALNAFGYAEGLRSDTDVRLAAWVATPAAVSAGCFKAWRVATKKRATVMHAHWVIPGGAMAVVAARGLPIVVSLHGSDVYIAERYRVMGSVARRVFGRSGWVTACSDDLRARALALGARDTTTETVPYGVDVTRFAPNPAARIAVRREYGIDRDAPLVFSAGRLVRKKGFDVLLAAARRLSGEGSPVSVAIAGDGDLRSELAAQAAASGARVMLLGNQSQDRVASLCAAADVVCVPSIHDRAGNVDGLPNFALEALASGTPVVATRVGGLTQAIEDGVTGRLVSEQDPAALADAIKSVIGHPEIARAFGVAARARITRDFGWARVAERFEAAYTRAGARPH